MEEQEELAEAAVEKDTGLDPVLPPEPGAVQDPDLGISGPESQMPENDRDNEEGTDL